VSFLRSGTPEQWKQRLMDTLTRLAEMKAALSPPAEHKPQVVLEAEPEAKAERDPDLPPMAQDEDW
jgi:hypothetical protein